GEAGPEVRVHVLPGVEVDLDDVAVERGLLAGAARGSGRGGEVRDAAPEQAHEEGFPASPVAEESDGEGRLQAGGGEDGRHGVHVAGDAERVCVEGDAGGTALDRVAVEDDLALADLFSGPGQAEELAQLRLVIGRPLHIPAQVPLEELVRELPRP